MPINAPLNRKLRMGLVGGAGGFIGRVHATAAALDGRAVLLAGALSSDPAKGRAAAPGFGIAPERAYASYLEMLEAEARRPVDERLDFISIATPNYTHFAIAQACLAAGFNVVCDKPLTFDLPQAEALAALVRRSGVVFALTHNYTGYPLVRQARAMVQAGALGTINAVRAFYIQGSLRRQRTAEQQRRFAWKTDPERAGASGCFGDIGIHAYNLVRFVTGLHPRRLAAHLEAFEPGGRLDDYGTAVLDCADSGLATITASRISHGRENDLRLEIDGTRGSLEWHQEEPNRLLVRVNGVPQRVYTPAGTFAAGAAVNVPAGLPGGFLQAFANVYTAAYDDMVKRAAGLPFDPERTRYPNVHDGLDGMRFVTTCVASARGRGAWVAFPTGL